VAALRRRLADILARFRGRIRPLSYGRRRQLLMKIRLVPVAVAAVVTVAARAAGASERT
jgi:hypothetical protein